MKIAVMFPGQGTQFPGMMDAKYYKSERLQNLVKIASEIVNEDLKKIFLTNSKEVLEKSSLAQVALLIYGYANYQELLESFECIPNYLVGHSVGEITALVAGNAIKFHDGIELVFQRGKLMDEAARNSMGGMMAVRDLSLIELNKICNLHSINGHKCVIAAYNSSKQTVLSGDLVALNAVAKHIEYLQKGSIRKLSVIGAFHSPHMKAVESQFGDILNKVPMHELTTDVISTVDCKFYNESEAIKKNLLNQLTMAVLWSDAIAKLKTLQVDIFFDIGPNSTLRQMVEDEIKTNSVLDKVAYGFDNTSDRFFAKEKINTSRRLILSKLLKVSICTKNHQQNNFEEGVIKPFRAIENLYENSSDSFLGTEHLRAAVRFTEQILRNKGYCSDRIETELREFKNVI
ncbi:MAG: ACP S-malonyltransferase [Pyrinomonadaceae bacterium]|nr:ACP S-malonyltransferase [Sphingobacteriaceae bacterium]